MKYAAAAKEGGRVAELMRRDLCYVHEDFSLQQVAEALTQTKQYVAVVVNSFDEFVGAITLERLMQEAFGAQPAAAGMQYEDRAAVAAFQPPQSADATDSAAEESSAETTQPTADATAES